MKDLLDKLNDLMIRTHALVSELELDILPVEGFQFSATGIGGSSARFFYLSVEVETGDGLRIVLGRRYQNGSSGSQRFDVDDVVKDLAITLAALSEEQSNAERRERLLQAVEEGFAEARSNGLPCRMTALLQKPIRIGTADGKVTFELLSTMLRDDLTRGAFSMAVRNAAEFTRILDDEVFPEQRERQSQLLSQAQPAR